MNLRSNKDLQNNKNTLYTDAVYMAIFSVLILVVRGLFVFILCTFKMHTELYMYMGIDYTPMHHFVNVILQ